MVRVLRGDLSSLKCGEVEDVALLPSGIFYVFFVIAFRVFLVKLL